MTTMTHDRQITICIAVFERQTFGLTGFEVGQTEPYVVRQQTDFLTFKNVYISYLRE